MSRDTERVVRRAVSVAVPIEASVLIGALLGLPIPLWVLITTEVALGAMILAEAGMWARVRHRARASGHTPRASRRVAFETTIPAPVLTMVRIEFLLWRSLVLWILRKQDRIGSDALAFHYRGAMMPLMAVFIGLSFVELVVFELLIPWQGLRMALLIVDTYGLVLGFAALAAISVRPHVLTPDGLRLRTGFGSEVTMGRDNIERARIQRRSHDGKNVLLEGETLRFGAAGQTTVVLTLRAPVEVTLPGARTGSVTEVRLHVDDPAGLVRALDRLPEATGAT